MAGPRGLTTKTLVVPCAGLGTRLAHSPGALPKPLVTVDGKPAFAHVVDMYPASWRVVFILGNEADLVRESIEVYYRDDPVSSNIDFVLTESHRNGGGLSRSLLDAQQEVGASSFVFHAVDSLISENPTDWRRRFRQMNQVFVAPPSSPGQFRYCHSQHGTVSFGRRFFCQGENANSYVGVAHINDSEEFWQRLGLLAAAHPEGGEAAALDGMPAQQEYLPRNVWFDVGTREGLDLARRNFGMSHTVLPKDDEAIWFRNGWVTKVHTDPEFVAGRVKRAWTLMPYTPSVQYVTTHTYQYQFVVGKTVSQLLNTGEANMENLFAQLVAFWDASLQVGTSFADDLDRRLIDFYESKTTARVARLLKWEPRLGEAMEINGSPVDDVHLQLQGVPWPRITAALIGRVHGDLHPDNMLLEGNKLTLVDWRQDFAGLHGPTGDIYYDLAKFAHGLRVDHKVISDSEYSVEINWTNMSATFEIPWLAGKRSAYEDLERLVLERGWSWPRVQYLEALIYLNIACLHEPASYRYLLSLLGRSMILRLNNTNLSLGPS